MSDERDFAETSEIDEAFVPVRRPQIASVVVDGEAVCYDAASGEVHVLNPTATLLWECFGIPGTLAQVIDDLVAEFDVDRARLRDDVLQTTREMMHHGLVSTVGMVEEPVTRSDQEL